MTSEIMSSEEDCPVCFEPLLEEESPLVCGHCVHMTCIVQQFKPECPLCRRKLDVEVSGQFPDHDIPFSVQEFQEQEIQEQEFQEELQDLPELQDSVEQMVMEEFNQEMNVNLQPEEEQKSRSDLEQIINGYNRMRQRVINLQEMGTQHNIRVLLLPVIENLNNIRDTFYNYVEQVHSSDMNRQEPDEDYNYPEENPDYDEENPDEAYDYPDEENEREN